MAFANIWQWLKTAASNTSLNGIALGENVMLPSGVNNAFREFMSQIATVESKGTDVASATTLALGTERYYHITGTITITDIDFTDAVDGRWAWLIFDAALTLTHNATTLQLPGGANIVTAAGDRALFVQDATDNVICLAYVPAAPVINTANGQYKFPASDNASSDPNTLDDYQEVDFTPALAFGGGTTGITYDARVGRATKIGNVVMVEIGINLSSKGSSTGTATISTLPYTPAGTIGGAAMPASTFSSLTGGVLFGAAGTTTLTLYTATTTGRSTLTDANFANSSELYFNFTYTV